MLIDDHDWSPEQGPPDAIGNTYSQELVWDLFTHFQAAALLASGPGLRQDHHRPAGQAVPAAGQPEDRLAGGVDVAGQPRRDHHRHLSPLIGFFPGDRIRVDTSPTELVDGARNLLTARGT